VTRARIAVLASGGGSNVQALIDHFAELGDARAGDIVVVASDREDAPALARALDAGIPIAVLGSLAVPEGPELGWLLREHRVDLVVLAGYLKYVPAEVTRRYAGRILNVHPSLLPAFGGPGMYGVRVHRAALASGVAQSGASVHFVDDVYDHGAVIAQWPVPIHPGDDERTLAARVLRVEHQLYPRVVQAVAAGKVRLMPDGRVESELVIDPAEMT
jgi:formyltetrahydrofolate-dependent phosphoribosylglycinamide formyltransferase